MTDRRLAISTKLYTYPTFAGRFSTLNPAALFCVLFSTRLIGTAYLNETAFTRCVTRAMEGGESMERIIDYKRISVVRGARRIDVTCRAR